MIKPYRFSNCEGISSTCLYIPITPLLFTVPDVGERSLQSNDAKIDLPLPLRPTSAVVFAVNDSVILLNRRLPLAC